MRAFYNEIDQYCCAWLSNLMDAGLITPGKIDDRSIHDIRPDDLVGYERVHFFAGIAGWDYALNLAGWGERHCWTGSCPCQPFSLAGKRKGFDDERHLWPVWRELIAECKPPVVFGEQVASASDWLRLVRSDLEAMGFAVGAIPVEAASAGADHKRDRYWFVADRESEQVGASGQPRQYRHVGDAYVSGRPLGTGIAGDDGATLSTPGRQAAQQASAGYLADTNEPHQSDGWEQPGRELGRFGGDQEPRDSRDLADALRNGSGVRPANSNGPEGETIRLDRSVSRASSAARLDGEEWVLGADGKARRVKPGIRLLAHGVPARVSKLRAFGNAIDPRPASQVIGAFLDMEAAA